jgi:PAS domain S-box-containing protein
MPEGTVLIVDGGQTIGESLWELLADQGYSLEAASNGPDAVAKAEAVVPDLVLVDADLGGLEACRYVRSSPNLAEVPILMALTPDDRRVRPQGLEVGVDDFVLKPFDRVELKARVRALTRLSRYRSGQLQLEAEIAKRNRQLLTLQSAGVAITSSLELQHVLGTVTREMADLLQMKACAILRCDQGARTVSVLAQYGPNGWWKEKWPAEAHRLTDHPLTEQVLVEQRARYIGVDQDDIPPDEWAYMERVGIKVVLKLPMIFQDSVMGLVEVMDDRKEHPLAPDEIRLAQLLANQAASAIENARLYDAIRRHIAKVTTLNRISQVISSILDLRETLAIIADHAHWLLDVAAASVILRDEERGDLWFGAASGEGSDFIRGKRLSKGKGIVNWVIQNGEPLIVPDTSQDPRFFDEWDKEIGFTSRSILCVPLKAKREAIGAIEAINKASGPFDQEDLSLLRSMAASAAIAIENARLYEKAQQELSERKRVEAKLRKVNQVLRTLGECHETLVHAQEESELLDGVCRSLVEFGGYCMAWVGLAEHDQERTVRVMAQAGDEEGYLQSARITWAETGERSSPTGIAIQTCRPCSVQDTRADWASAALYTEAIQQRCGSLVAFPLIADGQAFGALTICAEESGAFDAEEVELLQELVNDLALGIVTLRMRNERDRAEEEIRRLYQELQDHASSLEGTVAKRTRELQRERDRTQAILEALGEAVIVTDLAGEIQYLNPAAVALTGYTLEEAAGTSPRLWQPDRGSVEPRTGEMNTGVYETQRAEVVSRRKDGLLYDAATTVAPLFDSQEPGRLIGHVCVQRDITPIKEAERLKDEFVSNVSHELRTPLSVIALISGNLDRLYGRLSDERRQEMIRDIRGHAQVLNDLIGGVLDISRIESGRISMQRQETDLAQLAEEEADKQLPLAQKKLLGLRVIATGSLVVSGSGEQLGQVVRNLLNNAIKYTPTQGQITCECAVLSESVAETSWPGSHNLAPGRWAAVRVIDTGIGISQQDLPYVFDRFYRVKAQGGIPGTGLGLSIAKELIESHGGHIAAASTPGEGSTFAIYLPLLEE